MSRILTSTQRNIARTPVGRLFQFVTWSRQSWTRGSAGWLVVGVVILGFSARTAKGSNWYVDNAASGAGNGTSWANAWMSFSAIVWGSSGVKAGDTLYISGGSTSKQYNETLTVGASGSSGARTTISVGRDPGHNGQVIIDGQNTRTVGMALNNSSYLTISGNNGLGSTNFVFRNFTASDAQTGAAISGSNNTSNVVEYVETYAVNCPITENFCTGCEIRYCNLHDVRGDRAVAMNGSTGSWDANTIHHCTISCNTTSNRSGAGPDGIQATTGMSVYNCKFLGVGN